VRVFFWSRSFHVLNANNRTLFVRCGNFPTLDKCIEFCHAISEYFIFAGRLTITDDWQPSKVKLWLDDDPCFYLLLRHASCIMLR
jgi:hypothetical protein